MNPTNPRVFISYSHDSPAHSRRVLELAQALRNNGIDVELDQFHQAEIIDWPRWCNEQIGPGCCDFVLCVCTAEYLYRIEGKVAPEKGKGVYWEGSLLDDELYDAKGNSRLLPILFDAEAESTIPRFLRGWTHCRLTGFTLNDPDYTHLIRILTGQAAIVKKPLGQIPDLSPQPSPPVPTRPAPNQRIVPNSLRHAPERLFGREDELAKLDAAWNDPKHEQHVVTIVAWGGVGKTSLVAHWQAQLAARDFDGADYFDWSFYSQGSREQSAVSSDSFISAALEFFGDEEMAHGAASPWDKGARLAQLVGKRRTLLVLDGLEPLQYPPGPLAGQLKDPAMLSLLRGLAQKNLGLCLVTTRATVADLVASRRKTAPEWQLDHLAIPAGVELLKSLGVHGNDSEFTALVNEVRGHALTLQLLGRYLCRAHHGDIRRRDRVRFKKADATTQGGHAFRAIAAYETWLQANGDEGKRQLAVLRLIGLFDRPAAADCLAALRREPAIPDLTEPLVGIEEEEWNMALSNLADCGLISLSQPGSADSPLDAHPLVREYFADRVKNQSPEAWRAGHQRLYEHLTTTEEFPATLAGLQPLYQAVTHGCQAGLQQEACIRIYRDRILRGTNNDGFYSIDKLSAFGTDLGAVVCFFDEPWKRVTAALSEADQGWFLHQAAIILRALGRLHEAMEPMHAGLAMVVKQKDWKNAAISANNLSELQLTLGGVAAAVRDAELAVEYADRDADAFLRMGIRTTLADALHQAGRSREARELFVTAEHMQSERQKKYPLLYSLQGFRFCDLLLAAGERVAWQALTNIDPVEQGEWREACLDVRRRAIQALQIAERNHWLLTIAIDHLTLGRAVLYQAIASATSPQPAAADIEQVVAGLRLAGFQDFIVLGLLTRALFRFVSGERNEAREDLDEAWEIAARGPMKLFIADIHLHRARLFHTATPYPWDMDEAGNARGARDDLAAARRLIEECGYWRRKEELELAEEAAKGWGQRPELPTTQTIAEETPMPSTKKRFRIALSFPGEYRSFVEAVAEQLAKHMPWQRILYDKYYEAEFARLDLDVYLQRLYRDESELIAVFLCKEYEKKDWCRLEWRAVRELIRKRKTAEIMPFRFDQTEIPGLFSIDGYVSVGNRTPQEIADLINQRLRWNDGEPLIQKPTSRKTANGHSETLPPPPPSTVSVHLPLAAWQEKLVFLLQEEVKTVDPDQKFRLKKLIEEARGKIREYGG